MTQTSKLGQKQQIRPKTANSASGPQQQLATQQPGNPAKQAKLAAPKTTFDSRSGYLIRWIRQANKLGPGFDGHSAWKVQRPPRYPLQH
jgi:hypothetical protein